MTRSPSTSTSSCHRPDMDNRAEPRQRPGSSGRRFNACIPIAMSVMRSTAVGRTDGPAARPSASAIDTMTATTFAPLAQPRRSLSSARPERPCAPRRLPNRRRRQPTSNGGPLAATEPRRQRCRRSRGWQGPAPARSSACPRSARPQRSFQRPLARQLRSSHERQGCCHRSPREIAANGR